MEVTKASETADLDNGSGCGEINGKHCGATLWMGDFPTSSLSPVTVCQIELLSLCTCHTFIQFSFGITILPLLDPNVILQYFLSHTFSCL